MTISKSRKQGVGREIPLRTIIALLAVSCLFLITQGTFSLFIYNWVLLASMGALALNLLIGTAGQVSIGNAAFLAAGAYASVFAMRSGVPFPGDVILATLFAGVVGLIVGLPALRLRGFYLILATLAAHFIVVNVALQYQRRTVGELGFTVGVMFREYGLLGEQRRWTILLTILLIATIILIGRLLQGKTGRAWRMIRDHEVAAPAFGVEVVRYKLMAFALSSMLIGFQGAMMARFTGNVSVHQFTLLVAISYIAMIIIGGLDSIPGSIAGAAVVISLPHLTAALLDRLVGGSAVANDAAQYANLLYGILIILVVTRARGGMVGLGETLWTAVRRRWRGRTDLAAAAEEREISLEGTPPRDPDPASARSSE